MLHNDAQQATTRPKLGSRSGLFVLQSELGARFKALATPKASRAAEMCSSSGSTPRARDDLNPCIPIEHRQLQPSTPSRRKSTASLGAAHVYRVAPQAARAVPYMCSPASIKLATIPELLCRSYPSMRMNLTALAVLGDSLQDLHNCIAHDDPGCPGGLARGQQPARDTCILV